MDVRRLLHRWFIEYNPLYLLSAALVLRGVNVVSRELLAAGVHAELGGPAIAELYSWALIAGAAILNRIGLRRPAVMLTILAVLYQGDLTLHTETCAYLGWVGWVASAVWLASFGLKLVAIGRAMHLRVSKSAFVVPSLGAAGMVLLPRIVTSAHAQTASIAVAAWTFALFTIALSMPRRIESQSALDAWGRTVLRRSLLATWGIWAVLASLHIVFWFSMRALEPAALLPVGCLVLARFLRRDEHVWAAVAATLGLVLWIAPSFLCFTSVLAAITFAMHAWRRKENITPLLVGAFSCVYLAAWAGVGKMPSHTLVLDAVFFVTMAVCVARLRARSALGMLGVVLSHAAVQARVITVPTSTLEWGLWSFALGFLLLVASIGASMVVRANAVRARPRNRTAFS